MRCQPNPRQTQELIANVSAESLREKIAEHRKGIEACEALLALKGESASPGSVSTLPAEAEPEAPEGLKGAKAIRHVIALEDREEWAPSDVRQALKSHGIEATGDSVRVTMSRMYKQGEFMKPRDGIYVPKFSEGKFDSPATENDPDGGESHP